MEFVVDAEGDHNLVNQEQYFDEKELEEASSDNLEQTFTDTAENDLFELIGKIKIFNDGIVENEKRKGEASKKSGEKKIDDMIDHFFQHIGWGSRIGEQTTKEKLKSTKDRFYFKNIDFETGKIKSLCVKSNVDKCMEKSVLRHGLEKEVKLPELHSERRVKITKKLDKARTKGPSWYDMPAPEITEEIKNDLQILKMRSALDPKHFYKKNDMKVLPKYFQIGRVMDSPLDHHNVRLTKKERKRTLVDELLADAEFTRRNKRKYEEVIKDKRENTYRTYIKDKRKKSKEIHKKNKQMNMNKKKRSTS